MNTYCVKKIDIRTVKTVEEYNAAIEQAEPYYCHGLQEVWNYCGGKLHRQRAGYNGTSGYIDYIAYRTN